MTSTWAEHLATALAEAGLQLLSARHAGERLVFDAALPAPTLNDAARAVFKAVESTGLATSLGSLEIGDQRERVRRLAMPDVVGIAEIAAMFSVSRSRASRIARSSGFPLPLTTLSSGPIWVKSAVTGWSKGWRRHVGRTPKTLA
jgi:hypothetical protein